MDTVAYSELLVAFNQRLQRIAEGAEAVAEGDFDDDPAAREEALSLARERLARYERHVEELGADSPALQAQFIKRFEYPIGLIRASLARIGPQERA